MAQLIVRSLEPEVVRLLKIRAAHNGRSAEEEHREILRLVLTPDPEKSLKALLLEMPEVGEDEDFLRCDDQGREIEL